MMIAFVLFWLLLWFQTPEVPITSCFSEDGYEGWRPAYVALTGDDFTSIGEGDYNPDSALLSLTGDPFTWALSSFPADVGLYGMWEVGYTGGVHYLWAWTAESDPQQVYVLALDTIEPGMDGEPHGCGAYKVGRVAFDVALP